MKDKKYESKHTTLTIILFIIIIMSVVILPFFVGRIVEKKLFDERGDNRFLSWLVGFISITILPFTGVLIWGVGFLTYDSSEYLANLIIKKTVATRDILKRGNFK